MLRKFTPSTEVPKPSPVHISFYAKTRKEVDEFYRRGIEVGGRGNGEPGVRSYMKGYYGIFVVFLSVAFFFGGDLRERRRKVVEVIGLIVRYSGFRVGS